MFSPVVYCILVLVVLEYSYLALEQHHIPAIVEGQDQVMSCTARVHWLFCDKTRQIHQDHPGALGP